MLRVADVALRRRKRTSFDLADPQADVAPADSGPSRREKRPFNSGIDPILTISRRLNFSAYEALRQLQQPYAG